MAYNPYLIVPLATWAIAQLLKFAIAAVRGRINFRLLYASGGMPSVHSAVVCSLAATALLVDGYASHLFGFTAVFAAVVMYDSFGVRRSAGEQAAAINMLIGSLGRGKVKLDQPGLQLREILGHHPREVVAGAVLGILLAGLFNPDRIQPVKTFLQVVPAGIELYSYLGLFIVLLLGGFIARLALRRRFKTSVVMRQLAGRIFAASQTIGWLGLLTVLFQYERASYLSWRFWVVLVIIGLVAWALSIASLSWKSVPAALTLEADRDRKRKWFNWGQKGRKNVKAIKAPKTAKKD